MSLVTAIAAPLTGPAETLDRDADAAVAAGVDFLEFRLDEINDDAAACAALARIANARVILTLRCALEGGACHDADDRRAERLVAVAQVALQGADRTAWRRDWHGASQRLPGVLIDIEAATWRRSAAIRAGLAPILKSAGSDQAGLILSRHAFDRPDWLDNPDPAAAVGRALDELDAQAQAVATDCGGAPVVSKLAIAADDARDALALLAALERRTRQTIALAMGEAGVAARVLAPRCGGALAYAPIDAANASAPGQLTLAALRETFRFDEIGRETRVFGVVGWPVAHSRSPRIHNYAMRGAGIDGVFVPLPVAPTEAAFDALLALIAQHPPLGVAGLSVTIPHKRHALRHVERHGGAVLPMAARCGAVNTLTASESGWTADNTDAAGALEALRAAIGADPLRNMPVRVLGAGGAARAIVAALLQFGCRVTVLNRSDERAATLAADLGCESATWETRCAPFDGLIVNCTSVGMTPHEDETPVPAEALSGAAAVFDTVYTPAETRLLREARQAGKKTISGVEMFIRQAAAQFETWHNVPAPLDALRESLNA